MKKIANCKSRHGVVHGYIYTYTDRGNKQRYGYMPKGCVITYSSNNLTDIESYIAKDDFLSAFGVIPYYLKSFKRV